VSLPDVIAQYEARLLDLQTAIANLRVPHLLAMCIFAVVLCSCLVLSIYILRGQMSYLSLALPVLISAVLARRLQQVRRSRSRLWRLSRFYERAVQRIKGHWAGSGSTGEEYGDSNHAYSSDLQLFGEGSLFELLCTARTSIGQQGLADYLLQVPAIEETTLRQDAVRELRDKVELRERIATLGEFEFLESRRASFEEWLNSPELLFPRGLPWIAAVTSALLAGIVLTGLLGVIPWSHVGLWILPLAAFHAVAGLYFRKRVNRMADSLRPLAGETRVFGEGLQLLESERFESTKLRQLAGQARGGAASIRRLEQLQGMLDQRNKEWFYGPSLLLLAGTQICMAVEQWRKEHEQSLRIWLRAWAEFEALNTLAVYAYENPENTFPALTSDETCFVGRELAHPLLPRESCVANDISLDRQSPFYIVSGSNMSGKSTLLRTIGLNAVLAFAGAPVRATALRLSELSVVASLAIADSLANGKSKFLVEVERLRRAIAPSDGKPVMFLVDEILGGTNSHDRRIAAEAIVRALVGQGAIGAFSTHDLALTEIATAPGLRGVNVHMGSRTDGDPMDFDYRIKPGIATETNALAIARLAGVPV
jgi:MutS domain V